MLDNGPAVVRRCNCPVHQSRQLAEAGIRMRRTWGEAPILGRSGTKSHSHFDILDDRIIGFPDARTQPHPDAGVVRGFSVHGRRVLERLAVLRQDAHHVHAEQISTGLYVLTTSK